MATPQIRFDGFKTEWYATSVSSISRRHFGGGTPSTEKPEYWAGTIPWIQSSDLVEGQNGEIQPLKFIAPEAVVKSAATVIPGGSIAVVNRVGVGKVAVMHYSYATSQDFISLSDLTGDIDFHAINIQKAILRDIAQLQGSTIKGLTGQEVLNKVVFVPCQEEQQAVGMFFRNLDIMIADRRTSLQHLRNLKSSMLVKMFPQNRNPVPEIRFAGFTGEWKKTCISEITGRRSGGGTPSKEHRKYWRGTIPWVQSSDLVEGENGTIKPSKFITQEAIANSSAILIPENSIAVVNRVGVGKVAVMTRTYATSQDFISLSDLAGDINFLAINIQMAILKDIHQLQGGTIKGLTGREILNKSVYLPPLEEQRVIGNYFRKLDNLIDLEEEMLAKLTNLKTVFLNKMFV